MPATFFFRAQIGVETAFDRSQRLQVRAESQHVGVVMAPAVLGDVLAPGYYAANPRQFVGRDGDADPAAADEDAQRLTLAGVDRRTDGAGEVRIVDALRTVAAVV